VIAAALVVGATDARAVGSSDAPSHSVACVDTLEQPWSWSSPRALGAGLTW